MSSDFFYCPPEAVSGETLVIGGEEFAHLVHVMRRKEGDAIVAVDGRGNAYEAVISRIERRSAVCAVGARHANFREPVARVTLAAAVLKNPSRYDFLVEKAVELGVAEIIPLETERTISSRARSGRWRKLALAAMKQCGRAWLPPVRDLAPLGTVLAEFRGKGRRLVAHEEPVRAEEVARAEEVSGGAGDAGPVAPASGQGGVLLLVGPEGGFAPGEIESCLREGFEPLHLGARRLRTETAAVAALARLIAG